MHPETTHSTDAGGLLHLDTNRGSATTTTEPDVDLGSFLFCRNHYHAIGTGVQDEFDDQSHAQAALHRGSVPAVAGALAFDVRDPAALIAPQQWTRHDGPWTPPTTPILPGARVDALEPGPLRHRERVGAAVTRLADSTDDLQKVVLARRLRLRTTTPITPQDLAAALRADDPDGSIFIADLSAAPGHRGAHLVGASPEVLIRKQGTTVSANPLAGSAARHPDPSVDAEYGRALASSTKDRVEHRFVVESLASALAPLCSDLDVPDEPILMTTPTMWHLGTPIRGTVRDSSITALDLAVAVHPTPAVCGTPTDAAREHILVTECSRGFYAGAVGWSEGPATGGDGEWMVAIRCAEIAADGLTSTTWAGGGIVAHSDPDAEVRETEAKLATILGAFGLSGPSWLR